MPTPTYVPLATTTLGSSAATITFSSIPATYRDLIIVLTGTASSATNIIVGANNGNYVQMQGNGSSATSAADTGRTYCGGLTTSTIATNVIQIFDYAQTDKHKTILGRESDSSNRVAAHAVIWETLSAVSEVVVDCEGAITFSTGTTCSLYGVN